MGKRSRRRGGPADDGPSSFADLGIDLDLDLDAEPEVTRTIGEHGVLTLRLGMSPGTRSEYDQLLKGFRSTAAATQEDRWARAVEFLFERLVVRWEVAGVATSGQKDLLRRLRVATRDERHAIRDGLRQHLAEHLPDVPAP
ncbi:hypothetical protein [Paraconexibacter algicola]|uniref:Uncharacterized protein n=1 Tax=Paraconexibacter algicola TaxID=2133960 RepID=A0A2T4UHK1_9ACTN|nr:hypothetical protein [Paraconexibacter algicola]PTL58723.1 hypothetical protein C7Y72_03195 [Paraconexibacter algicola]